MQIVSSDLLHEGPCMFWKSILLLSFSAVSAYSQVQAVRGYDVYDSVGVNTHWYFGNTYQYQPQFSNLTNLMVAAQIRHFRDGVYATGLNTPPSLTQMYQTLANQGIHGELIVPQSTTITMAQLEAGLQFYPGVEAIEPPNEWDINGGAQWTTTLLAEEPTIYGAGRDLNLPVLGPALTQVNSYAALGNVAQYMDYSNMHIYFSGRNPETGGWGGPDAEDNYYGSIPFNLDLAAIDSPGKQTWATETGYHTTPGTVKPGEIPESVAGTYAPRTVLESFKRGIKRTYFYELVDDPSSDNSGNGLLRFDLTPKPAYTAIKNLLGILQDNNTQYTPGTLQYTLTGNTSGVETFLVEKSAGTFWLAIWLNGCIYDVNALQATPIAPQQVTLSIPGGRIATYVATFASNGTTQGSWPNAATLNLNVNSNLIMVRIAYPGK
jgi:hypothetical protein